MVRIQDIGEIAYGGAVAFTEWWDNKRIADGKLAKKDLWKKASFYTYLGIGLPATLISAFGWWRPMERWAEHISHGFFYDFPRFIIGVVQTMGEGAGTHSSAVREAERIREQMARKELEVGSRRAERSYQHEFDQAVVW